MMLTTYHLFAIGTLLCTPAALVRLLNRYEVTPLKAIKACENIGAVAYILTGISFLIWIVGG